MEDYEDFIKYISKKCSKLNTSFMYKSWNYYARSEIMANKPMTKQTTKLQITNVPTPILELINYTIN